MSQLTSSLIAAVGMDAPVSPYGNTNVELVLGMSMFAVAGFAIVFTGLLAGKIARPD